jgi:hypothetical protein
MPLRADRLPRALLDEPQPQRVVAEFVHLYEGACPSSRLDQGQAAPRARKHRCASAACRLNHARMEQVGTVERKEDDPLMTASPEQLHVSFQDAFNRHDLDSIVALYERDAVLARFDGPVQGRDAIREA